MYLLSSLVIKSLKTYKNEYLQNILAHNQVSLERKYFNSMNYRSSLIVALVLGVLAIGAFYPKVDAQEREGLILYATLSYLDQVHFRPMPIDDEFSKKVYDNYLSYIDPGKRYLTQQDLDLLKVHEYKLDDQATARTFEFFDLSLDLLDKAMVKSEEMFNEVIKMDFDFTKDETIELDAEKKQFAKDDVQLKEYWRKTIKYDIISRLNRKIEEQEELKDNKNKSDINPDLPESDFIEPVAEDDAEPKSREELIKESIEKTKESFDDWFDRMAKLRRSDRFESYLNAITHLYDPHSDYFNPKEKKDFDIRMGGKLEGIGARLSPDGDYTKVVSIVAGGPAWKGKELEVNDLIMAVTQKGEETLDITGMRLDDVVDKIRGKKGTVVILKTKKKDGSIVDIEIERDVVQIEETFAKSLLLNYTDVIDNIGYIKLPKFYSSFERKDGNSCSVDVAAEIEKLKDQNVNGIILDLRNNGGGSLRDVVDMSGLFIKSGPIVQVKSRMDPPQIQKDSDPEVRYDGPLLVLVNGYSASASEILAAALQDYDRAVIVGGNSTFGKGTVQRFFDLDRAIRGNDNLKPLGQVKLTLQKFFRINGGSTQLKGVVPDIILPDNLHYIDVGEKEYDLAMEWTEIEPVQYNQEIFTVDKKAQLKTLSEARVQSNEAFNQVLKNALRLKSNKDETQLPLNLEKFDAFFDAREAAADEFEGLFEKKILGLKASNMSVDMEKVNFDEASKETNDEWLKAVESDIYLEESLRIMKDMIGK